MKQNGIVKGILLALVFVIISVSFVAAFKLIESAIVKEEEENPFSYGVGKSDKITFGGKTYSPNKDIETLLILGIDSMTGESEDRDNSQQADFIALVVMNRKSEKFEILHINRDTITEIPETDINGRVIGTKNAQLTLAHTYGNSDKERCRNTVDAVENLLYGIDITHYLSMTMDAVAILNDSVGGVTVTLEDDFTHVDPGFMIGETVTLKGNQALSYVRARGELEDSTNLNRMKRQREYISALLEKYNELNEENTLETMMKVNEYLVSDCTIDQLSKIIERMRHYSNMGIETFDGESVVRDGLMEYHIDENSARETVIEMFFEEE